MLLTCTCMYYACVDQDMYVHTLLLHMCMFNCFLVLTLQTHEKTQVTGVYVYISLHTQTHTRVSDTQH